jgi:hypothetical protein
MAQMGFTRPQIARMALDGIHRAADGADGTMGFTRPQMARMA